MTCNCVSIGRRLLATTALLGLAVVTAGCEEPQEKVLDVDAPGVDVEVHKDKDDDGAAVDIGVEEDESESTE
ncbi:hypothetical protein Mal4_01740 [Maioricimonas rarisocia]|uniref:Secreted protein n=1 Tax=Maioricimonas rarisocia TaxID=2528026 RepID=A0A517Z078_9PLAN|nr:hypothetical protein [Maioricimonas rarisocia]QDU35892.1 hypothetical protein Mal4_01740 [Maioricimonas rarisocia]